MTQHRDVNDACSMLMLALAQLCEAGSAPSFEAVLMTRSR
jgi:hypothetical protein